MKWDTTLSAALIGAAVTFIVTALGWWNEYRKAVEQRQREAKLTRLQRQIEELYGPLWGLLKQSYTIYSIAVTVLPSEKGKVKTEFFKNDEHYKIWDFFIETYLQPINLQIAEIITTKIHLLDDGEIPQKFIQFLKHEAQFRCLYRLKKQHNLNVKGDSSLVWPDKIEEEVKKFLDTRREEYNITLLAYKQSKTSCRKRL